MPQLPSSSPYAQTYVTLFQSYQDELLQRLETLVNIDLGTGQVEGVNQIMIYLEQWLRESGFTVTLHPTLSFGCNRLPDVRARGRLAFCWLDTLILFMVQVLYKQIPLLCVMGLPMGQA